jgi:hypothetical protein
MSRWYAGRDPFAMVERISMLPATSHSPSALKWIGQLEKKCCKATTQAEQ